MRSLLLLSALLLAAVLSFQPTSAITVHLVPHSHDDVGWQVTVDQYYIGSVQYIITTVIEQLLVNPDRKFIYVEQAYFQRWWREQNDAVKDQVRSLVKSGQLEFINGGWCMHDEASTHYIDMIDQTTYGHRFITEQFGVQPKVGWQIDPFGHSATQAALLSAEVGFEALFFGRIDYQDYNLRAKSKRLEWIWEASESLGADASLFTGQFWNGYGPPSGFNFDIGSNDAPVQDDSRLTDYNVDQRVDEFVRQAQTQSEIFQGENIMWTMGSDFQYSAAHTYFTNLDKLIKAVNADGRVKAQYSTPSIYVEAKHAEGLNFTLKTDDIFPYSDGPDAYWTGYFTSRAALKRYVRVQSAFLQVARHLELFGTMGNGSATEALWEAMGVAQHHDGVSGTAKQAVTFDYAKRLSVGGASSDAVVQQGLAKLLTKTGSTDYPTFTYCPLANTSVCAATVASPALAAVALYNALAHPRTELVRIPVSSTQTTVLNGAGNTISSQVVALPKANPARVAESLPYEVRFVATVPGLGVETYFISTQAAAEEEAVAEEEAEVETVADMKRSRHLNSFGLLSGLKAKLNKLAPPTTPVPVPAAAPSSIQNDIWRIDFDTNGLTASITNLSSGTSTPFVQNFFWYHSFQQSNQQNSGAYIFRPADKNDAGTPVSSTATLTLVTGAVTSEAQQTFAPWLTQVIRLTNGSAEIQFEYTVGPIPVDDKQGKEIISRYATNIASNGTWYTDSNGREWQQRIRNYRPTWNWDPTQPVAGNYYPVNTGIVLADTAEGGQALSILNDRSQGGASLHDGELELMLHRRLTMDDGRGVGEPLNEPGLDGKGLITTGIHYVQLGAANEMAAKNVRTLQNRVYAPLHWSIAPLASQTVQQYLSSHNTQFTFQKTALPYQVELVSAYAQANGEVLIRLAHNYGVNEGPMNSASVDVDLSTLFAAVPKTVVEKSLTNNQTPADVEAKKLKWNVVGGAKATGEKRVKIPMANTTVSIGPMEIRTFVLTF